MKRGEVIILTVPIFLSTVVFTQSRRAYAKERARYKDKPFDLEECSGISSDLGCFQLVGVFEGGIPTLIHELGHVTFKILKHCNVPANHEHQEAFCLLHEWLYAELAPHMKEPTS